MFLKLLLLISELSCYSLTPDGIQTALIVILSYIQSSRPIVSYHSDDPMLYRMSLDARKAYDKENEESANDPIDANFDDAGD